jgi:hypothetical protein
LGGATNTGKTWSWGPDAAEESLNTLIERRAKEADDANHYAQAWAESVRRYNLRVVAERRQAWVEFHARLAATHQRIAEEHQGQAERLAGGGGRGPLEGTKGGGVYPPIQEGATHEG